MSGGSRRAARSGETTRPLYLPCGTRGICAWCAADASLLPNHTPFMWSPDRKSSPGWLSPITPPQLPPRVLSTWMPRVKPYQRDCVTIWHVVNLKPSVGLRTPWIFSMSAGSSNSFMPIGWVRMRSSSISLAVASASIAAVIFSGGVQGGVLVPGGRVCTFMVSSVLLSTSGTSGEVQPTVGDDDFPGNVVVGDEGCHKVGDVGRLGGALHRRLGVPQLVGGLPAFGHGRIDQARRHAVDADVGPERQRQQFRGVMERRLGRRIGDRRAL